MKTKIVKIVAIGTVALAPAIVAPAAVTIYTSETCFTNALTEGQSLADFDSSPIGPITGTEFASSGFTFHSPLSPPLGQLAVAPADWFAPTPYLNIDERPYVNGDGDEDRLEVTISGDWRAFGFRLIDGQMPQPGEAIILFGNPSNVLCLIEPPMPPATYIGVVAGEPIRRVSIIEARNDGDDVGYDDFRLGNPATLPPPSLTLQPAPNGMELCWSCAHAGFRVEVSEDLTSPTNWVPLPNLPDLRDDRYVIGVAPAAGPAQFFRLTRTP